MGKAFGKKVKDDLKTSFDSDSSKKKISAPIPIQHSSLTSLDNSELLKKGFCLPDPSNNGAKLPTAEYAAKSMSKFNKPNRALSVDNVIGVAVEDSQMENIGSDLNKRPPKTDAAARNAFTITSTKAVTVAERNEKADRDWENSKNRGRLGREESSRTSSSSQDTITEQSVSGTISRESSREERDGHDNSQTESVSQSSSTESALEQKSTCRSMASRQRASSTPTPTCGANANPAGNTAVATKKTSPVEKAKHTFEGGQQSQIQNQTKASTVKPEIIKSGHSSVKKAASLIESSMSSSSTPV